jgi:hypothetical protein
MQPVKLLMICGGNFVATCNRVTETHALVMGDRRKTTLQGRRRGNKLYGDNIGRHHFVLDDFAAIEHKRNWD